MFGSRTDPHDVFTPRSPDLNDRTYAKRPNLEEKLKSALKGHKFIIIHGESGNGKTWLYKKVFAETNTPFYVINLARMNIEGNLTAVLLSKLGEFGYTSQVKETQEVDGGIKPGGIGLSYKHQYEYKTHPIGVLEALCQKLSAQSKGKKSVLVLDNFEQIIDNDDHVRQIASLIISADEEFISRTGVKILIVGTPNNIKNMISKVSNAHTIANRFVEIPEVARLELAEARYIMQQGFENHLKYTFVLDKNEFYKDIAFKTDRIAQHVQELCLKIAEEANKNKQVINANSVADGEKEWLDETLSVDVAVVEGLMNSLETRVGRKNQVMFCLGQLTKEDFKHQDVEEVLRDKFHVDKELSLNIPQILGEFSKSDNPIIKKNSNGSGYHFCSPKVKMVIRAILKLSDDGKVVRR